MFNRTTQVTILLAYCFALLAAFTSAEPVPLPRPTPMPRRLAAILEERDFLSDLTSVVGDVTSGAVSVFGDVTSGAVSVADAATSVAPSLTSDVGSAFSAATSAVASAAHSVSSSDRSIGVVSSMSGRVTVGLVVLGVAGGWMTVFL